MGVIVFLLGAFFQVADCFSKVVLDLSLQGIVKVALAQLPLRLFAFELSGVGTVVLMPTQAAFDLKRYPNHESLKQNEQSFISISTKYPFFLKKGDGGPTQ